MKHNDPASPGPQRTRISRSECGVWINYKGQPSGFELPLVRLLELPRIVRLEAAVQARAIVADLMNDGEVVGDLYGDVPIEWIEVLGTLATAPERVKTPDGYQLQLGRWDATLRYVRVGLRSYARDGWEGWRKKLARRPRYALRANFLRAMQLGWGVRGEHRWNQQPYWEPTQDEYKAGWKAWLRGDAPEPHPVNVVNVQGGSNDLE